MKDITKLNGARIIEVKSFGEGALKLVLDVHEDRIWTVYVHRDVLRFGADLEKFDYSKLPLDPEPSFDDDW